MKIAVLSDSHERSDYTKEVLDLLISKGAQYIIHAGDLVIKSNLELLKETNLPYVSVYGNNDNALFPYSSEFNIKKEPYYFKIKDVKFKLMHLPFYMSADDCDVIISGHTHIFKSEYIEKTLFLNPGEVCARDKDAIECALLEINEDEYIIDYYQRNINEKDFKIKEIRYERTK